jgi:hypothetical protein
VVPREVDCLFSILYFDQVLNLQKVQDLACNSFASTDDGIVAGCSTKAEDGLVQVGWGEQVGVNTEIWGLIMSLVLTTDTEAGT